MIRRGGQRMEREAFNAIEAVDTRNFEAMVDLVLRKIPFEQKHCGQHSHKISLKAYTILYSRVG
jgi:hypothetical protein